MITLRDYQQKAVDDIWAWFSANETGHPLAVLPTGAGKSIICARLALDAISFKSKKPIRVLVITHSKELVGQNYEKFTTLAPDADAGVFSAALNRRDRWNQIIFASIQSAYKAELGKFDLVIVDECHRIPASGEGTYHMLISNMTKANPKLRVIGLTATPYRMKTGWLHKGTGRLFTDIATEVTIQELLKRGFLCPIVSWRPAITADLTGVKKTGGDFNIKSMAEVMTADSLTERALHDAMAKAHDRRSWLIFGVNIEHCEQIAAFLQEHHVSCEIVTGATPPAERDERIDRFKRGEIQCLVNCEVLTTGFDSPAIDCIILLRGTESTGLYQQIAGRGMRPYSAKKDCLLLDYAGNIERHGCLDDPQINTPKTGKGKGIAPTKFCPHCDYVLHLAAKSCQQCGYVFPEREAALDEAASEFAALSQDGDQNLRMYNVSRHQAFVHEKNGRKSIRLIYFGINRALAGTIKGMFTKEIATEWLHPEHSNSSSMKFVQWWLENMGGHRLPKNTQQAVAQINEHMAKRPAALLVKHGGKYPEIMEKIYV